MVINSVLALLVSAVLSNNCLVASGIGVDITTNKYSSLKNITIYSAIVLVVGILTCALMMLINNILDSFGLLSFSFIAVMVLVALLVQMAEFVTKKLFPLFFKQSKYFVPILAGTLFMFYIGTVGASLSFLYMLLYILFQSLGLFIVLAIISGIKRNCKSGETDDFLKGNVMSLIVVFVLFIIWTAF